MPKQPADNLPSITHDDLIKLYQEIEHARNRAAKDAARILWKNMFKAAIAEAGYIKSFEVTMLNELATIQDPRTGDFIYKKDKSVRSALSVALRKAEEADAEMQRTTPLSRHESPATATA